MTTFHVGQRVRIVQACDFPELVGREARVVSLAFWDGEFNCHSIEIHGTPPPRGSTGWYSPKEWLEPILYDGNKVVSWSECLWRPEGVSV